ncbi:hypothetical protein AAGS61_01670 [Lysinibacillus sp. KU-BSD001]|uniref:hypothetical protein n=1 Tax=Lysinibacillus sp. KU-BSD001 TaxID=3141328 RepID=UPI0036F16869
MGKESTQQAITLEDGVHIVQGGKIVDVLLPKEYGQDIINWQHGSVFEVSESKRRRIKTK